MKKSQYAEYKAGDAFMAGHLGEWTNDHKSEMTKTQLAHLVALMENYGFEIFEGKQDPIKMAKHLNLIFENINEKING
jgi:hypothetical protein